MPTIGSIAGRVRRKSGIHIKPSHKGLLHKKLGIPEGQPIPAPKLAKAKRSSSAAERKEATFATNAKNWDHSLKSAKRGVARGK